MPLPDKDQQQVTLFPINPLSFPFVRITTNGIEDETITAFFSLPEVKESPNQEVRKNLKCNGFEKMKQGSEKHDVFVKDVSEMRGSYICHKIKCITVPKDRVINKSARDWIDEQIKQKDELKDVEVNKFQIIMKPDQSGYAGRCGEIKGAISQADTEKELEANMIDAIQLILDTEENWRSALTKSTVIKTVEIKRPKE
jgi:predicted RNase H-like HicB family nuclease